MKGIVAFLKRKEMGLPVWAWTLIVAVILFVLYRYMRGRSPKQAASVAPAAQQEAPAGDLSSGGDASGSSTPSDSSGQLQGVFPGEIYYPPDYGYPFDQSTGVTDTGAPAKATVNAPGSKVLNWAGVNFTTQAQFDSYLKSKGLSVKQFARNHPAAYTIYSSLAKGTPLKSKTASKTQGSTKGVVKNGSHTTSRQKPKTTVKHVSHASAPTKVYHPTSTKPAPTLVSEHGKIGTATKTAKTTTKPKPAPVLRSEHGKGQAKPPAKKKAKR